MSREAHHVGETSLDSPPDAIRHLFPLHSVRCVSEWHLPLQCNRFVTNPLSQRIPPVHLLTGGIDVCSYLWYRSDLSADTAHTERFMDRATPEDNQPGYQVRTQPAGLPGAYSTSRATRCVPNQQGYQVCTQPTGLPGVHSTSRTSRCILNQEGAPNRQYCQEGVEGDRPGCQESCQVVLRFV